ncbi:MAG: hypothetical protein K0Q73_5767 [Paenibacillus sp.]|jgi:hypothetical protein|nr:hypothetical protein [Paenibacillus sp.]
MLKVYGNGQDIENTYQNKATDFVKAKGNLKFLRRFYDFLQIFASHYTLKKRTPSS